MPNIEAIIVDGVRYDKVEADTEFACERCALREICDDNKGFADICLRLSQLDECWEREEEL